MKPMNIEYDPDADALYVYFQYPSRFGDVKNTVEVREGIILDFDKGGKLLGIEILRASHALSKKAIIEAKKVGKISEFHNPDSRLLKSSIS